MANTKSTGKAYTKTSRCWPGYEPVPGKGEHQEGSCRKKPASRNAGQEVDRETARKKQVSQGGKRAEQARSKSPSAAERAQARAEKTSSHGHTPKTTRSSNRRTASTK